MTEIITIPLFPLGLVLLPGMRLPLHIFEERYKQMIADCLVDRQALRDCALTARPSTRRLHGQDR